MTTRFILASSSPRRLDLLSRLGLSPDEIIAADIDETPLDGEMPRNFVRRMAFEKLQAIYRHRQDCHVLAGDTVVAVGRRILPKAETLEEARHCLGLLSGRRHHVLSAIALGAPDGRIGRAISDTVVQFKRLSPDDIQSYLASDEWQGKAGGYAIQGLAEALIKRISGSHSSVMGLPLFETRNLLRSHGVNCQ